MHLVPGRAPEIRWQGPDHLIIPDGHIGSVSSNIMASSSWNRNRIRSWHDPNEVGMYLLIHARGRRALQAVSDTLERTPPQVAKGQDVFQGQIIGIMGSTGSSTGAICTLPI